MGNARTSFLDVRDIAEVTAKALTDPAHQLSQTYELNGPEAVTNAELAERISRVVGREVKYVDISEDEQRMAMLGMGMPTWQVDALLGLQRYYTQGQGGEVTDVLPKLLGHSPIMLDGFLAEHRHAFGAQKIGEAEANAPLLPTRTDMSINKIKRFVYDHFHEFVNGECSPA
jgi:uncharacterized protein YbjT (DUF2867 family)